MSYAETIKALRQKRGMSQRDLARRVGGGLTNQSISGWERGKARPSPENMLELAKIFGVSMEAFMDDGGPANLEPMPARERPDQPRGLVFAAVEEAFLQAGINAPAAAEIALVVELYLANLLPPSGMTPEAAIRRIMRLEVPEILARLS